MPHVKLMRWFPWGRKNLSREILERHLTPEQRETLNRGFIDILHKPTGHTFRLLTNEAIIKCYGGAADGRLVHMFPYVGWGHADNRNMYVAKNVWAKGPGGYLLEEYSMLLALKLHVETSSIDQIQGCSTIVYRAKVDAL